MNTNNPVRKSIILIVVFFIAFAAMVTMACDEGPNPCSDGSACGILEPNGEVVQDAINYVQDTCRQRADGTCKAIGEE